MIIGVFFLLCGLLYSIGEEKKFSSEFYFGILFFAVIGGSLVYFGLKRKKFIKNFKTYVQKLSVDPTGSISGLASTTGTSVDVVKKNLEKMISKKFFVNAYIDVESNCIIFPASNNNINVSTNTTQFNVQQNTKQPEIEYVTVTCKSCGGINKVIKGKVSECDFCGSPIKEG
jgi:hypothetical protein